MRGGIVDVFPSTADAPVRIDLWGDEVDRLTAFSVSDQRSSHDLDAVALYGCRELVLTAGVRASAAALGGAPALGGVGVGAPGARARSSTAWSRGSPSSTSSERVLPDLLPAGAQVVLVEPRRIRDRGGQLLDEEAALAETLAATWGAKEGEEDSVPAPARALRAPPARLPGRGRRPAAGARGALGRRRSTVRRFDPVAGDPARLAAGVTRLVGRRLRGHAVRRHRVRGGAAVRRAGRGGRPRAGARGGTGRRRAPSWSRRPSQRVHPARRQGGGPLGDRRHGPADAAPAGPAPGPGGGRVLRRPRGRELRRPPPARRGPLRGRDDEDDGRDHPGLPDPAVPGLRPPVPAGRADRGDHPLQRAASRRRSRRWAARTGSGRRARARAAAGEVAAELVAAVPAPPGGGGARLRPRHAVAGRDGVLVRLRRDRGPAEGDRRRQGRHGGAAADGPPGLRRRRLRQDRGGRARRLQGGAGRDAGGACWSPTTLLASQHAQTFADRYAPYPVRVELLSRFLSPAQQQAVVQGWPTAASTWSSARTGCWRRTCSSRSSASSWSTRSSASG